MKIVLLGSAGFIGTNLILRLAQENDNEIIAYDSKISYFIPEILKLKNVQCLPLSFTSKSDFNAITNHADIIYHLVSTIIPATSNVNIAQEINSNVMPTIALLDSCVKNNVKKIVFISSGGTVYGKNLDCPIREDAVTYPITSYGLQKITIEKLLYLYNYMYNLDYLTVRLANPYGPYQRPNGILGAVTTFTYKALNDEPITVYGNGSIVRDYIYIDDVIDAIIKLSLKKTNYHTYNIGSGNGTSLMELLSTIEMVLNYKFKINFANTRKSDIPVNYLSAERYKNEFGKFPKIELKDGIKMTAEFMINSKS